MSRSLIVVDVETTGLGSGADILEVAAVNVATSEELHFAPYLDKERMKYAEPKALQINRYYERGVWADMQGEETTRKHYYPRLQTMLDGNTFAGSNPTFDSRLIARHTYTVWHHRLADLAAYAAGVLGLPPTELPGLDKVCALLDVDIDERHSAIGDARATAECFRRLIERVTA